MLIKMNCDIITSWESIFFLKSKIIVLVLSLCGILYPNNRVKIKYF